MKQNSFTVFFSEKAKKLLQTWGCTIRAWYTLMRAPANSRGKSLGVPLPATPPAPLHLTYAFEEEASCLLSAGRETLREYSR